MFREHELPMSSSPQREDEDMFCERSAHSAPWRTHVSGAASLSVFLLCLCVLFAQADGLWDPPLLRPQYDGPGGPAHRSVPRGLLHYGWHRRGNLPGGLPRGGVDGSARGAAHLHDHNSPGIATTAGFAQL